MKSLYGIEYKDGLFFDLHLPKNSNHFNLFVYFHGGGLEAGTRGGVEVFAKTLAKNNIATASVDYRLYPNAKFPEFIQDCAFAVRWFKDNIKNWGKVDRLLVGGSSAGAYISMSLCFNAEYLNAVGLKPTDVDFYFHNAGQPTVHYNVLREMGQDSKKLIIDERAPAYYIGSQKEYSPMLFVVSDNDIPCRLEQTLLTVKTLENFGHKEKVYLEIMHGKHCEYDDKADDKGNGIIANLILKHFKPF